MEIRMTRREVRTVVEALQRASGWSDLGDNGKFYGKRWMAAERRYLVRCLELEKRLTQALVKRVRST